MSDPPVSSKKHEVLRRRLEALGIDERDIIEKFVRSSGKGGQKVNKTSTCVYLKHVPSGIEVKCQEARTQALNRFLARRILADKVEAARFQRQSEKEQRIAKIRRQKRKRSKRAKLKMLEDKSRHSRKKKERSFRPGHEELE